VSIHQPRPRYATTSEQLVRRWLTVIAGICALVVATIATVVVLLLFLLDVSRVETKIEVVKVALAAGAGAGALVTLVLAVRRQLLAEETAETARKDMEERRLIDLYSRGVEQIASQKPEVQIGGLYALERLAENVTDMREQVMDIVCAFLRNPQNSKDSALVSHDVRLQFIAFIRDHLAHEPRHFLAQTYWDVTKVSLAGASLPGAFLGSMKAHTFHSNHATYEDRASFDDARLWGANFAAVVFKGEASFAGVSFGVGAFPNARFCASADFSRTVFELSANFNGATFAVVPKFDGAKVAATETAKRDTVLPAGWQLRESDDAKWLLIVPSSARKPARRPRSAVR
jgi:hypothetical protein